MIGTGPESVSSMFRLSSLDALRRRVGRGIVTMIGTIDVRLTPCEVRPMDATTPQRIPRGGVAELSAADMLLHQDAVCTKKCVAPDDSVSGFYLHRFYRIGNDGSLIISFGHFALDHDTGVRFQELFVCFVCFWKYHYFN